MRYSDQLPAKEDRLQSLDVLRGVAVLGILFMNIYAFAMPWAAYMNPLAMGGDGMLDLGVWFATHIFFDQKFMSIFSMLFGAGIVLMATRAEAAGVNFAPLFFRRQLSLLAIGALHAYLLWFGDILFFYAVIGMLAWFFRRLRPGKLILIACLLLPVAPIFGYVGGEYLTGLKGQAAEIEQRLDAGESVSDGDQVILDEWLEQRPYIAPESDDRQRESDAYRSDYGSIVRYRAPFVSSMHLEGILFFGLWRVGGLMLLGMALFKLGVLAGHWPASTYRAGMILGYGIGLPLCVFSAVNLYSHEFDAMYAFQAGGVPNYVGSLFVAMGHVSLLLYGLRRGWMPRLAGRLAAVGRMALTNYLLHSIVLTTVFYGYGLGLYGEVSRSGQMLFVMALAALQLGLSTSWLSRFRFGPAEWLWRSLTYGRLQPMRR